MSFRVSRILRKRAEPSAVTINTNISPAPGMSEAVIARVAADRAAFRLRRPTTD